MLNSVKNILVLLAVIPAVGGAWTGMLTLASNWQDVQYIRSVVTVQSVVEFEQWREEVNAHIKVCR